MELGIYTGVYKGKEILGFIPEHTYVFDLKHNGRTYLLHAFSDVTYEDEIEDVNLNINYASEISIKQRWGIKESDVDS